MIVISKENLNDKVLSHGFKTATIYDRNLSGLDPSVKNIPYFEKLSGQSPEDLVEKINKFDSQYPGQFSVILKSSDGGYNSCMVNTRFMGSPQPQNGSTSLNGFTPQNQNPFETPQQMEDRILNKIRKTMEADMLRAENNALKAKLDGLNTTGGKLANMLEMWVEAKFLGKKVPSLQGTPEEKTETETEVDQEKLKLALAKILDLLGADTVIKLSDKLQAGDPIVTMVKNYANS